MLISRDIYPDEILAGYRGHLRFLNRFRDGSDTTAALNEGRAMGSAGTSLHPKSFVHLLSALTGRSVFHLVRAHSMWPFTAAMRRTDEPAEVEEFMDTREGRTSLMRTARQRAWLCPHCVKEDLAFWGTSYWRRSHQSPGVLWCCKHVSPLMHTHVSSMEAGPPDHCAETELLDTRPWSNGLQGHKGIQTYLDFCSNILEGGALLEPSACRIAILNRAATKGLHCLEVDNVEKILAQVPIVFPVEWLAELDRRYVEIGRGGGSMARQFLRGHNLNASMQIVALLIATVYSTADEALMDLTGPLKRPVEQR